MMGTNSEANRTDVLILKGCLMTFGSFEFVSVFSWVKKDKERERESERGREDCSDIRAAAICVRQR